MDPDALQARHRCLRDQLVRAGLFLETGVDGVYGRTAAFERVVRAFDDQVCRLGAEDAPEAVEYPPVLPRSTFDRMGYLGTFPQLAGTVFSFDGDERDHAALRRIVADGESYADALSLTDLALTPACCYPVYPAAAGRLPEHGRLFEMRGYCFRHEPSVDPMRLQSFRQREHVRIGTAAQVEEWRTRWLARVPPFFAALGLTASTDVANDPFFGRAGRLMANAQLEQELKFEFSLAVYDADHPTACGSLNSHQEHFGELFGIESVEGVAHTACVGFGLERCAIALFARHGMAVEDWPESVRSRLWP